MTLTQVIEAAKKTQACDIVVQYKGGRWTAYKSGVRSDDILNVTQDELVRRLLAWADIDTDPDDISNVRSVALSTLLEVNNVLSSAGWEKTGDTLLSSVRTAIVQVAAEERVSADIAVSEVPPVPPPMPQKRKSSGK